MLRLPLAIREARVCAICEPELPLGAKPLLQGSAQASILIVGQAPGTRTHEAGFPWRDASGNRLRQWLGVSEEQFYDPLLFAHMPMGFCYPGKGKSGDSPPRPECAPMWHPRLLRAFKSVRFTIFIGKYAFERYLSDSFDAMSDAIQAHELLLPDRIALPHPSPRNNMWLKKNAWFERDTLPKLKPRVAELLAEHSSRSSDQH